MSLVWRIYYSDGTTYGSDDGAWENAPGIDCQVVLFHDPDTGWAMRHNADYFRLDDDGSVVGMDRDGLRDFVVGMLGIAKEGRMLSRGKFNDVYQQAKADMAELKTSGD